MVEAKSLYSLNGGIVSISSSTQPQKRDVLVNFPRKISIKCFSECLLLQKRYFPSHVQPVNYFRLQNLEIYFVTYIRKKEAYSIFKT